MEAEAACTLPETEDEEDSSGGLVNIFNSSVI